MKIFRYINFLIKIAFDFKAAFFGSKEFPYDERSESSSAFVINYEFALKDSQKFYPHFDNNGIPIASYLNSGFQYNPTRIASYGLANYNRAIFNSDDNCKQLFFNIADWFVNQKDNLFLYNFKCESLEAPWISCMAQGQGISVLCRAYKLSKNEKYLKAAKNALKPFTTEIHSGGLLAYIDNKLPILEEFPFINNPEHVLNGFLYAIIGIVEIREIDKTAFSESSFKKLLFTAQKGGLWSDKNWSIYDLQAYKTQVRNSATVNYHRVHIAQYKYLAFKFPDMEFDYWAKKWENQYKSLKNRLIALKNKTIFRLKYPATRF